MIDSIDLNRKLVTVEGVEYLLDPVDIDESELVIAVRHNSQRFSGDVRMAYADAQPIPVIFGDKMQTAMIVRVLITPEDKTMLHHIYLKPLKG